MGEEEKDGKREKREMGFGVPEVGGEWAGKTDLEATHGPL